MELKDVEQKGILVVHRSGLPLRNEHKPHPVLLMISGLPDSVDTWDVFAEHFRCQYHVVTMAYPYLDKESLPLDRQWGYSTREVTTALLALIQEYRSLGCSKIYLILDWS